MNQSISQSVNQSINQSINQQSINQSINQSVGQLNNVSFNQCLFNNFKHVSCINKYKITANVSLSEHALQESLFSILNQNRPGNVNTFKMRFT